MRFLSKRPNVTFQRVAIQFFTKNPLKLFGMHSKPIFDQKLEKNVLPNAISDGLITIQYL